LHESFGEPLVGSPNDSHLTLDKQFSRFLVSYRDFTNDV
jgi:hypothetical protein